jgi:hypothetical protein
MSAAASCRGAAEKESPPCLQCPSDTQNPGVETEATCGGHTETWRRHKRLLAGTATADDMTFTRNLIVVERAVERARIHKLNESLLSLPAKSAESAGKDDVAAARRTGQKKRTREEVEVEKDEVEGEEEKKERIRHNTNLLRVLARKELMDLARLNSVSPTESKALIVEALACVLDIRAAHVLGKAVFWDTSSEPTGPTLLWHQFKEKYKDEADSIIELLQSFYDYAFDAFAGDLARNTATNTHVIAASAAIADGDVRILADGDKSGDYCDLYMGPCR